MTAPDEPPGERGQRVSECELAEFCKRTAWLTQDDLDHLFGHRCALDLRDLRDSRATIADLTAEIERLRDALATARRDGWIEGRDAAADEIARLTKKWGDPCGSTEQQTVQDHGFRCHGKVRALAPAEAEGKSDV